MYLHVHVINDDALAFYQRLGFEIIGKLENYYKRISPPDCFVLSQPFGKFMANVGVHSAGDSRTLVE